MDIRSLRTFILVAEMSSFTRAAEALGYAQSTVSFQIRQLETELGAQLFERINHTIMLTQKGREVLDYAHRISKLAGEMESSISEEKDVRGHVRLAMADSLCDSLLREHFAEFRRRWPGVTLKIIAAGTQEMFRLLNHNEVDVILTLDSHIYNTDYVIAREARVGVHFVAEPGHPLASGVRVSMQEVAARPFILTEKGMSYRRLMDERLACMSLEIQPVLEIGSTERICSLVRQGVGMSFLPDYVTAQEIAAGRMARVHTQDFDVEVWKQMIYHRDKWVSPQMEAVIAYCADREFSSPGEKTT